MLAAAPCAPSYVESLFGNTVWLGVALVVVGVPLVIITWLVIQSRRIVRAVTGEGGEARSPIARPPTWRDHLAPAVSVALVLTFFALPLTVDLAGPYRGTRSVCDAALLPVPETWDVVTDDAECFAADEGPTKLPRAADPDLAGDDEVCVRTWVIRVDRDQAIGPVITHLGTRGWNPRRAGEGWQLTADTRAEILEPDNDGWDDFEPPSGAVVVILTSS